ncbi:MAG: restriction endonuclease subunit S [Gemmatimonadales bacterium]|nr:restriction endonuclease subunit S [Gemmatimonadales bacterium]MDZ4388156.1 restriction endonuclease subunit S [Gemmatimonadales bacterium]
MSFPRYPKYKDSGVEWLPEIPFEWETTQAKHVIEFTTGWTPPTGDAASFEGDSLWANISDLGPRWLEDTAKRVSEAAVQRSRIKVSPRGSLLFSFKLSIGQVSFAARDMYTNEAIATFLPSPHVDLAFAYYAFPLLMVQNAEENIYGAKLLNQELLRTAKIALPDVSTQRQIASFLDRETAKIDALVAEQQRLMELLKEKRQAVISHAVTKGLNPDAPMKPSGVEWLGEVPAHWELRRLKFLCDIQTGSKDTENAVEDGEFPFFVRSQTIERINSKSFDCEAIFTAGDGAGVGKVFHHYTGPFDFHQRVYMMNSFRGVKGTFLFHFLRENFFKVALEGGAKSTVDSLRRPVFTNFWVAVPPQDEQIGIVEAVERDAASFDALWRQAERAVAVLEERRSALISAAVTGQIDVRNLANEAAA